MPTGHQSSLRKCLNQILTVCICGFLCTIAGGVITLAVLDTKIANLDNYIKDPNVCLGRSVCKPEFEAHKVRMLGVAEGASARMRKIEHDIEANENDIEDLQKGS